ncbi:MAG: hypothetical protein ACP5K9_02125 [Candidatus Micrarchaeia archaeon]
MLKEPEKFDDDPKEDSEAEDEQKKKVQVSIAEPMFIWVLLLVVSLVVKIILLQPSLINPSSSIAKFFGTTANFILFMPGSLILPIIVGAVIGAEIGTRAKDMKAAMTAGVINGIYVSIIYVVAIVIIYEIILYVLPNIVPTLTFLVSYWLVLPAAIVILLSMAFAALSHSRKVVS